MAKDIVVYGLYNTRSELEHAVTGLRDAGFRATDISVIGGEPRGTHRWPKRNYVRRVRTPSMLDPHVAMIEGWLAGEPQLTALPSSAG